MNILFIPFYVSFGLVSIIWFLALLDAKTKRAWNKFPKVSFIIPSYNSQSTINETIDSVFEQDYRGKTEVIVYASGNLEGYSFEKYKNKNFKFLKGKGKIEKAIAVNRASKKAKGNFLFIIDSDTVLKKDALRKMMLRFKGENVGAVTASRTAKFTGFWSLLQNFEYVMTNIILTSYNKLGSTVGVHGCAMCFRKKAFEEIKGIARVPAQDFDSALRLIEKKWKVICEIQAVSITLAPSFLKWIKQRFRWMRGFSLALLNHYKVFIKEPFGLFFTIIYSLIGLVYVAHFFINQGFLKSAISLALLIISFKLPLFLAIGLFTGFFGWALYDRIILLVFYSCLSIPYIAYPYRSKDFLKLPLVFAYSIIYLPLFVLTGLIGVGLAIKDKIQGRKIIKW
jgi:cellulose synthase/poly-beta-1,6-N-acetylglucosamine synthase-like glycosyltransferase